MIVDEILEETKNETLGDVSAGYSDRTGYGGAQFVAGHARNKIEASVDGFREALKFHAIAQEVGAHGEHDVNGDVFLLSRFQEEVEASEGFGRRGTAMSGTAETEQLFRLVDIDEKIVFGGDPGLTHGVGDPQCAAAKG